MDYSKLSDFEINKRVARVLDGLHNLDNTAVDCYKLGEGNSVSVLLCGDEEWTNFDYCNNVLDAWPIITTNYISLNYDGISWSAFSVKCYKLEYNDWKNNPQNPLRIAMILFLMMQEVLND